MTTRGFFRSLLGTVFAGRLRAQDGRAPTRTAGISNGRTWEQMTDSDKLYMVVGINDALTDVLGSFDALLVANKDCLNVAKFIRNAVFCESSFGEIQEQISMLYKDPANAFLPVMDVYRVSLRRLKGGTNEDIEKGLAYLRKMYSGAK